MSKASQEVEDQESVGLAALWRERVGRRRGSDVQPRDVWVNQGDHVCVEVAYVYEACVGRCSITWCEVGSREDMTRIASIGFPRERVKVRMHARTKARMRGRAVPEEVGREVVKDPAQEGWMAGR